MALIFADLVAGVPQPAVCYVEKLSTEELNQFFSQLGSWSDSHLKGLLHPRFWCSFNSLSLR